MLIATPCYYDVARCHDADALRYAGMPPARMFERAWRLSKSAMPFTALDARSGAAA